MGSERIKLFIRVVACNGLFPPISIEHLNILDCACSEFGLNEHPMTMCTDLNVKKFRYNKYPLTNAPFLLHRFPQANVTKCRNKINMNKYCSCVRFRSE